MHLENSITSHRPLAPGETLDVDRARSRRRAPHAKGTVVDFVAEVRARRRAGVGVDLDVPPPRARATTPRPAGLTFADAPERHVEWRLPGDLGRRYAAVSGDRNPIHLYPLTAKALGFPRQIAHGMWSLARCVAALENRLPDAVRVDVAFKKPILLPGTVAFGHEAADGRPGVRADQPEGRRPAPGGRAVPVAEGGAVPRLARKPSLLGSNTRSRRLAQQVRSGVPAAPGCPPPRPCRWAAGPRG